MRDRGLGFVHGRPLSALRSFRDASSRWAKASRRPSAVTGRPEGVGLGVGARGRRDAAQHGQGHRRRQLARPGRARLRRDRRAPAGERDPGRSRHHLAGRARSGEDAGDPLLGRTARRVDARRRRLRDQRRPLPPGLAVRRFDLVDELGDATPIDWVHRSQRYGEKLATPDTSIADLIGEVDPIKIAEGRYLSDELALHYGLIPRVEPGHLRHQRVAGSLGADPGRAAQHLGGARRADPRPPHPAAARHHARGHGQPRGLHQPGPHHHAAQGPLRRADPHSLPLRDVDRGPDHGGRG